MLPIKRHGGRSRSTTSRPIEVTTTRRIGGLIMLGIGNIFALLKEEWVDVKR